MANVEVVLVFHFPRIYEFLLAKMHELDGIDQHALFDWGQECSFEKDGNVRNAGRRERRWCDGGWGEG
jgi:hypothetical protein